MARALQFTITLSGESHPLNLGSLWVSESDQLTALTGWERDEWIERLTHSNGRALAFAWWLACRRDGVDLDFAALDFDLGELEILSVDQPDAAPLRGEEAGPTGPGTD